MDIHSINYYETIEKRTLVYTKLRIDRVFDLLSIIFPVVLILIFLKISFAKILSNSPKEIDYFLAILLPIITIGLGIYMIKKVLHRNQLKSITYSIDFEEVENLICQTGKYINWKLIEKTQNILIFKTDRSPLTSRQKIIIILTPSEEILFNSSPGKDFGDVIGLQTPISYRRARFDDNYINFQANFKRLEKIKTAANNGSSPITGN